MAYRDVMRWLGHQKWFAYTAAKLAPLDAKVVKRTGGKFGLLGNYGLPQCLLTTTGRKSGQKRTVTLLYGTRAPDELVLIGSNFGQKHHPAWALNLEANPQCTFEVDGHAREMSARMVTDAQEREAIWQLMYEVWPAYNAYRGRAGREIKVFVLTPA
ncbi:MAG: nitroreductase family deazaflavin-dependent oxidoreductase [Candidatus Nanopelagicales bacterium]